MHRTHQENGDLAKAKAIGRKRRRQGRLWPAPIRETDLGHIYADVTVSSMAGAKKSWTGRMLVDTGATDTFVPGSVLRKLGIKPIGKRRYEMADGREHELVYGIGAIELLGETTAGSLVFAGENDEPLLGVTVLESAGFWIDPGRERLIIRPPKLK